MMSFLLLQFDIRAKSESLKEQEAKKAVDNQPVVAEAPKTAGPGGEDEDDESDLDIDNL